MAAASGLESQFGGHGFQRYLENLLHEAGDPSDPIQRMLIEQAALAHFCIGRLQGYAARAEGAENIKVCNAAAARLLSEFRRTAVAIREYRDHEPGMKRKRSSTSQDSRDSMPK
jgi:hypothetical protein